MQGVTVQPPYRSAGQYKYQGTRQNYVTLSHSSRRNPCYSVPDTANNMAGDDAKPAKKVNGLTKPMTLSKELAAIVGAKKDEKLARSEIIKRLWAYLKEKKLQVSCA